MKSISTGWLFEIIISIIKFNIVYQVLGTVALYIIFLCCGLIQAIPTGEGVWIVLARLQETDAPTFIITLKTVLQNELPFGEIAERMVEDSGSFVDLIIDFTDGKQQSFEELRQTLFPSIVNITIANMFIFIFSRINIILSRILKGFWFGAALFLTSGLFGVSGFCLSATVMKAIEHYIPQKHMTFVYVSVMIICFSLHVFLLSGKGPQKINIGRVAGHLAINLFGSLINSILVWFICNNLDGLYQFAKMETLVIAFIVFTVVLIIEQELTSRITCRIWK